MKNSGENVSISDLLMTWWFYYQISPCSEDDIELFGSYVEENEQDVLNIVIGLYKNYASSTMILQAIYNGEFDVTLNDSLGYLKICGVNSKEEFDEVFEAWKDEVMFFVKNKKPIYYHKVVDKKGNTLYH